jgi:BirA family biotin operon repressor/biotin-[acetyl-CoA-carboxylase] ligase
VTNADAARTQLDAERLTGLLAGTPSDWPPPLLLLSTGSTNDEVAALATGGAPEGTCVVAEEQTSGRGRQGREWVSPVGAGLWASILVRPGDVPKDRWGWLSLAAGLAAHDAVRSVAGVPALLKWPNDIVVNAAACGGDAGPRKLGGILSQVDDATAVCVGIGINVSLTTPELPIPQATSILLEGGTVDREALLVALLEAMRVRLGQWRSDDPVLVADYREACLTIGRLVDVAMPNGSHLEGEVTGIDDDGHLKVTDGEQVHTITAGDVIHASL